MNNNEFYRTHTRIQQKVLQKISGKHKASKQVNYNNKIIVLRASNLMCECEYVCVLMPVLEFGLPITTTTITIIRTTSIPIMVKLNSNSSGNNNNSM